MRLRLRVLPGRARPLSRAPAWEFGRARPRRTLDGFFCSTARSGGSPWGSRRMRTRALRSTRPAHRRTTAAAALLSSPPASPRAAAAPTSGDASPDGPGDAPGPRRPAEADPVRLTTSFADAGGGADRRAGDRVAPTAATSADVRVTSAAGPVEGRGRGRHVDLRRRSSSPAPTTRSPPRRPAPTAARRAHPHLPHRRPDPRRADLRRGRAARRRDRRRRHARRGHLRPPGHRPGAVREAHARHQHARAAGLVVLAERPRGALPPGDATGRPAPTSRSTSTSTASRPATASTARSRAASTSTSATPTSTRSTPRPTRCRSSPTASCCAPCRSPPASRASPPARAPR